MAKRLAMEEVERQKAEKTCNKQETKEEEEEVQEGLQEVAAGHVLRFPGESQEQDRQWQGQDKGN